MNLYIAKVKRTLDVLGASCSTVIERIDDLRALEVFDFKDSNEPPKGEYLPFACVDGLDKRFWIKASFQTPKQEKDCAYFLKIRTGLSGWDAMNPQLIFYIDGKMVHGLDINHFLVPLDADRSYDTYCYLYSGRQETHFPVIYEVIRTNKRVEKLYYDMVVPHDACRDVYSEDSKEYSETLKVLSMAADALDLRLIGSPEYYESVEKALEIMEKEYYEKLCSVEDKPIVNYVGHTHIDVEWLWDRRQTREKIQRSASTAVTLMKEYPEYKFMLSQPELYRYLKEEAPEKYEEVKSLIKEGRWEVEGALYLECDCNLTSGESLVRQLLYGKRFFEREFGHENRVCFLPDVFGYSAAMPQILKKSDVDYFVTSKISWNDTNTMPHDAFVWQGIDGTEIFSSFITGQPYRKGQSPDKYTTYVGDITPAFTKGTWERFKDKEYSSNALCTYGFGDGGGGPTREMLERGRRLAKGMPGLPVAKFTHLRPYLDTLSGEFFENAKKIKTMPKWVGELYLEYHRGTYTSQAATKKGNRKSELALGTAEAVFSTDLYFGGDFDREKLGLAWRDLLHNQFHDILPGSSIEKVYEFAEEDYARILGYARSESERKLASLAGKINTKGGVLVYNPAGFARRGEFLLDGKTVSTKSEIPAFGYAVIQPSEAVCTVSVSGHTAENRFYKLTLDNAGRISSLYDKTANREVVLPGTCMNEFSTYEDYPLNYDAWDIDSYAFTKEYKLDSDADILPVFDGERAGFVITRKYQNSEIKQTMWLYSDSARIDLVHHIDWHEKHQFLKLAFPVNVHATSATYDIQFGHTQRPTHKNTSWDQARFEVCGHKWVDISEYGYGVSILNDCKYGYSAEGSTIKLTCLKCPDYPAPSADVGEHEFTCSIFPHEGDFRKAGTIKEAYALNIPLVAMNIEKSEGTLPDCFSLVSCDNPAVIVETVKPAEDSNDVIVRLYESFGGGASARIKIADGFKKVYLTNLMEKEITELPIVNGEVELNFHSFEIKTLKLVK